MALAVRVNALRAHACRAPQDFPEVKFEPEALKQSNHQTHDQSACSWNIFGRDGGTQPLIFDLGIANEPKTSPIRNFRGD